MVHAEVIASSASNLTKVGSAEIERERDSQVQSPALAYENATGEKSYHSYPPALAQICMKTRLGVSMLSRVLAMLDRETFKRVGR